MAASGVSFIFSWRLVVTIMCFWSITNMMYLRLNMSVAIVCMVNNSQILSSIYHTSSNNTTNDTIIYSTISDNNSSNVLDVHQLKTVAGGSIEWDTIVQGQVLGSYYYGYAASKIPTGWAMRYIGSKKLILASSLASSIVSLLIPIAALHSSTAVILIRVFLGLCGGMICPAIQGVLSNWSPPAERSRMGAYTFAGLPCGTLAAFILAALLCEFGYAGGWPSVFYTFGMASFVFCLMWAVVVSETPGSHGCITRAEKEHIQESLTVEKRVNNTHRPVPWKSILTSLPVYSVLVCGISVDFVGNVFLSYLPKYMVEVMNFDIAASGLMSALPYVFCFLSLTFGGYLSDYLIKQTKLTTTTVRKLASGSGMFACIVCLVCISFVDSHQSNVAVTLLVISLSGIGLMTIGYFVNPMDIAAEYAGVVVGIASVAGDISGFISPAVVSAITSQGTPRESWQIVFLMSAAVITACLIFYICFASGEIQPWATISDDITNQHDGPVHNDINVPKQQRKDTAATEDPSDRLLPVKSSV